jgi:hypothetical protein
MASVLNSNGLFTATPGTRLLGEIITWSCSGVAIKHLDLIQALRDSGLEEGVARELAPRHTFARACKKLREARIIRHVSEDNMTIHFQFTAEHKDGDHFRYDLETMLTLEKATGKVSCDLPGLATLAQEELDRCLEARTGGDVTRIIQKLFEREADLFPIREQGGAYFCPQEHVSFLEKVQAFLGRLNGRMYRFPVPAGTPEGDRSVKESVAAGIATLIKEHEDAVACFGEDTRPSTLERAADRIRQTRFKLEAYSDYLAEEKARLEKDLSLAAERLRAKVQELMAVKDPTPQSEAPSLLGE